MAGYSPTHIPIPKNHADFERKATALFREILKDQDTKRFARDGQAQYGIDIVGNDGGNVSRIVGIQCKKKKPNEVLTAKEVRDEVRKALKYKPALYKYVIVTTAPKDGKLEQLAQTLTLAQKTKGRNIKIEVWGWDLLEEKIEEYTREAERSPATIRLRADPGEAEQTARRLFGGPTGALSWPAISGGVIACCRIPRSARVER
jgi:hypothetical protein